MFSLHRGCAVMSPLQILCVVCIVTDIFDKLCKKNQYFYSFQLMSMGDFWGVGGGCVRESNCFAL